MITVVREMAHRVATELAHMSKPRLGQDATDEEQDAVLAEVVEKALAAAAGVGGARPRAAPGAARARRRRRGRLRRDVARRRASLAGLRGEQAELPEVAHHGGDARAPRVQHEESEFRYCTNFIVSGNDLADGPTFIPPLEELGDSVLVVGDRKTLRVHVHTDDPDRAVALFDGVGTVERLDVADMHEQQEQRTARLAPSTGGPLTRADLRGRRGRRRRRDEAPLPRARRERGRGRLQPQPEHLRAARRHPRGARRRGDRAAEQLERDHGRRPRGRAVGEDGRGGRVALAAGRAGMPRRAQPRPRRRGERAQDARRARRGARSGAVAPAARDDKQGRFRAGRRGGLRRRARSWPGATRARRSAKCSSALGDGTRGRDLHRAATARRSTRAEIAALGAGTAWRWSATRVARRTTGGCWPPSERSAVAGERRGNGRQVNSPPPD